MSVRGNPYGSQYHTVYQSGNIKFVEKNSPSSETLMETMTKRRVYVLMDRGRPKSIIYFDTQNKRSKQIDLKDHHGLDPHVHHGYEHNEYSENGKPTRLSTKEKRMVDRVLRLYENHIAK